MDVNNELQHHGVRGQKWGVRRYQNKDGSLTKLGKKRAGQDGKSSDGSSKKKVVKDKLKKATIPDKPKQKSVSEMSDDELKKAINRARDEDIYRSLRPEKVSSGKKFITTVGTEVIAPASISAGRRFLENSLNKFGDNLLKDKMDPNSLEGLKIAAEKLKYENEIKRRKRDGIDDNLSWEDRKKKQEWEMKEEERKSSKSTTSSEKSASDGNSSGKTGRPGMRWGKKTSTDNADDSSEPMTGTVYGKGSSEKRSSNNQSNSSKTRTTIDLGPDDWRDVTDEGRSSRSSNDEWKEAAKSVVVSAGKKYISGYLESRGSDSVSGYLESSTSDRSLVDDILDKYYR